MLVREPRPARVGPFLDRGVPVVGKLAQVGRGRLRVVVGGHDERRDDRREGGGRQPGVLFPAILPGRRSRPGDEAGGRRDHALQRVLREQVLEGGRVRASHAVHLGGAAPPERSGQEDGIGGLVELDARPVRHAVHPLVLDPGAVGLLGGDEIRQRAPRGSPGAEGHERTRRLDQVP